MPTDKDHELHLKEVKIDINAPENLSTATGIEVDRQLQVEGPVTVTIADIGDADAKGIQIGGASQFELTGLLTVTAEMGGVTTSRQYHWAVRVNSTLEAKLMPRL